MGTEKRIADVGAGGVGGRVTDSRILDLVVGIYIGAENMKDE